MRWRARWLLSIGLCLCARGERVRADDAIPVAPREAPSEVAALDALEAELAAVMDELVAARVRTGVLARALFRTRLTVEVVRRADAQALSKLTLLLDGVPVHESDGSVLARDRARLFEGHLAPGLHELRVEVSERDRLGGSFGYQRSERYRIEVKPDRRTEVELILRDDSDMAEQLAEGDDGSYDVATELRVRYARGGEE